MPLYLVLAACFLALCAAFSLMVYLHYKTINKLAMFKIASSVDDIRSIHNYLTPPKKEAVKDDDAEPDVNPELLPSSAIDAMREADVDPMYQRYLSK